MQTLLGWHMELHVHVLRVYKKIWMGLINVGARVVGKRKFVDDSQA